MEWSFPKKRNWLFREHPPATLLGVFLDADDSFTPDFKQEIEAGLAQYRTCGILVCALLVYFLGRKLRGGYPMKKLAFVQGRSG